MKEVIEARDNTLENNKGIVDLTEELEDFESDYLTQKAEEKMADLKEKEPEAEKKADSTHGGEEIIDLTELVSDFSWDDTEVIELTDEVKESALPVGEIIELTEKAAEPNWPEQEIIELTDEVAPNKQISNEAESEAIFSEVIVLRETLPSKSLQENFSENFEISAHRGEGQNRYFEDDEPCWGSGLEKTFELEEALSREEREVNEDDPATCLGIEFEEAFSEDGDEKNQPLKRYYPKKTSVEVKLSESSEKLPAESKNEIREGKKYLNLSFQTMEPSYFDSDAEKPRQATASIKIPEDIIDAALERVIRKVFSEKIEHIFKVAIEKAISEDMHKFRNLLLENE